MPIAVQMRNATSDMGTVRATAEMLGAMAFARYGMRLRASITISATRGVKSSATADPQPTPAKLSPMGLPGGHFQSQGLGRRYGGCNEGPGPGFQGGVGQAIPLGRV